MFEMDARLRKSKIPCCPSFRVNPVSINLKLRNESKTNYFTSCFDTFSSRVLNRPGGTCQITLGGYTPAELERMKKNREAKNDTAALNASMGTEKQQKVNTDEKIPSEPTKEKQDSSITKKTLSDNPVASTAIHSGRRNARVSSNAFASSSTTNSYNVLTDRPTSRVSNPPGGKTSFTLG